MNRQLHIRMFFNRRIQGGLLLVAAMLTACDARAPFAVTQIEPASITITTHGSALLTSLGDSAIAQSQVLDRSGTGLDGVPLRWSVVPAGIVQADAEGVFRAVANGRVMIIAEIDIAKKGVRPSGYWAAPLADTVVVEVRQRAARLEIAPIDTAFAAIGGRRQVNVRVVDARGNPLQAALPTLTWKITDPRVITIDSTGVVRSVGEGMTYVSVHAEDLESRVGFSVRPRLVHTSCMTFA